MFEGPRWYRSRIRSYGPVVGLAAPAVVGVIALISLRLFEGPASGAIGLLAGVCAAPGLLAVGAPFGDDSRYPLAVLASVAVWLIVGVIAARRATRDPFATWADFWRHLAWLAAGIWVGAGLALAIAALVVSDSLV